MPLTYDEIVGLYVNEKMTSLEIAELCGIESSHWIRDILKKKNVVMRDQSECRRRYKVNQDFFETIDTEAKAYFLGLLAADSCVDKDNNCISISLIETDKAIIETFKRALESDIPIKHVEFKTNPQSSFRIFSEKMKNDLGKLGIVPLKSLILKYPTDIPDHLIHHMIRGYIDGDGEVSCRYDHYSHNVNMMGTLEFLTGIHEDILRLAGIDYGHLRQATEKNTYRLFYKTMRRLTPLYSFLYKDAKIFLKRKHDSYLKVLASYNTFKINNIFLKKEQWQDFDAHKLSMFKMKIFNHYRTVGFPYITMNLEERQKAYQSIQRSDTSNFIKDKIVYGKGSNFLADYYFPQLYEVRCHDNKMAMDVFKDDELFMKVVDSRVRFAEAINDNTIRRGLKFIGQTVSNFRPLAAKAIYDHFTEPDSTVLDMSSGWGGRLIGALASNRVAHYIGVDPNSSLRDGYDRILEDLPHTAKVSLHCLGSEEYFPEPNSLDLCFTSPPYFDTEKYSNEDTQSYKKYPQQEAWLEGFLKKTFENCYTGLKPSKLMLINIKNVKNYPNLEQDTISTAISCGFKHIDTYQYLMALSMYQKSKDKNYRYEPIFVFQKP